MYGSWDSTRWVAYDHGDWLTLSREDLAGGVYESYDYPTDIEFDIDAEDVLGSLGYVAPYGWESVHSVRDGWHRTAIVESV